MKQEDYWFYCVYLRTRRPWRTVRKQGINTETLVWFSYFTVVVNQTQRASWATGVW